MDVAPSTVEAREVASTSIDGLSFPDDALWFRFLDEKMKVIGPNYFITEEIDVDSLKNMKNRHRDCNMLFGGLENVASKYALVTWPHPDGPQWSGRILLPLDDDFAVVERSSGRLVWSLA